MDPNTWVVIALCFNVIVLAMSVLFNNKEKQELRVKAMKAEIKSEIQTQLQTDLLTILLAKEKDD